jgi:hypothetical protein
MRTAIAYKYELRLRAVKPSGREEEVEELKIYDF